ncbi:hypothetical protein PMAYCL1PPCAC_02047, partial [Pristionchus mayeri]
KCPPQERDESRGSDARITRSQSRKEEERRQTVVGTTSKKRNYADIEISAQQMAMYETSWSEIRRSTRSMVQSDIRNTPSRVSKRGSLKKIGGGTIKEESKTTANNNKSTLYARVIVETDEEEEMPILESESDVDENEGLMGEEMEYMESTVVERDEGIDSSESVVVKNEDDEDVIVEESTMKIDRSSGENESCMRADSDIAQLPMASEGGDESIFHVVHSILMEGIDRVEREEDCERRSDRIEEREEGLEEEETEDRCLSKQRIVLDDEDEDVNVVDIDSEEENGLSLSIPFIDARESIVIDDEDLILDNILELEDELFDRSFIELHNGELSLDSLHPLSEISADDVIEETRDNEIFDSTPSSFSVPPSPITMKSDAPLVEYSVVVGPIWRDQDALRVNQFFCWIAKIQPLRALSKARFGFLSLSFHSPEKEREILSMNPLVIGRLRVQVAYPIIMSIHFDGEKLTMKDVEEFLVSVFTSVCWVGAVAGGWDGAMGEKRESIARAKMVNANEVIEVMANPMREWKKTLIRMDVVRDLSAPFY